MPGIDSQEILLESQTAIAQLLMEWIQPQRKHALRRSYSAHAEPRKVVPVQTVQQTVHVQPSPRPRTCSCGTCLRCLDNARWERIFNEKFADPSYYGRIAIRHNSSLADA